MPSTARRGRVSAHLVAVLADDDPDFSAPSWAAPAGTDDLGDRAAVARAVRPWPAPAGR